MTAYTSTQSGDFSDNATWGGGGTPTSNGDTFTVSSGHSVKFNVDLSGLANGLGASTVNGTLFFSRTAGIYYLKMNATLAISTTGTLDASDGSGGAYPSNCAATIKLNGAFSVTVSGSGVVNLICGEPTNKYIKLSGAEAIGQTTLSVDTDVTAETLWVSGALVRIDDVNQAAESEERVISGSPTATTLDITVGLTAAKSSGAYVILISRNVKILGTGTASGTGLSQSNFGATMPVGAEIRSLATGISGFINAVVNGTVSGCATGLASLVGAVVNGAVSGCTTGVSTGQGNTLAGLISGCTTGVGTGTGHVISGVISGCNTGVNAPIGITVLGSIVNCGAGVNAGSGLALLGASLNNNTRDLDHVSSGRAVNALLGSSSAYLSYNTTQRTISDYFESLDHDQTAGAFRAWTRGGITSSVASPVYDASRPRSYNAVCESADAYAFLQRTVLVPAGGSVAVRCYIRKDASMSYLPRVHIFSAEKEPLISGSPDAEVIMTNSTDTWEVLEASVTNTTDAAKLYTVRTIAKNASGNVYFDPIIWTSALLIPADTEGFLELQMELKKSTTAQIVQVLFLDTTSVIGAGKTGLAYNTAGLSCYYKRNKGSASTAVTLADMSLGTFTDSGFKEVDAAHMPGLYEFGVPDAALAAGSDGSTEVTVMFAVSGAVTRPLRFDLIALDKQDSVRFGLSALPNAAAGANGGLPLGDGSGRVTVGTNSDKTGYGLADGAITAAKIATAAIDADALAADAVAAISAAVSDPLENAVPGAYAAGTAGYKLGLLGTGAVTVVSPVNAQSGDLEIVRGDDYTASSGRTLPEWSSAGWSVYDLSTAVSITFRAKTRYSETIFEKAAEAVSDTLVRVELTAAETSALVVGSAAYRFDVEALLASGDVVTLAQGHISIIEDVH